MNVGAPVNIQFGLTRAANAAPVRPTAAILAAVPAEGPWYADLFRPYLLRDMRQRSTACSIEHLRLYPAAPLHLLPGLGDPAGPTRVADTVSVLFAAGAPTVDLLLVRAAGAGPDDLHREPMRDQILAWLPDLSGAVLCLPDLGLGPARETWATTAFLARMLRDAYLTLCLDVPDGVRPGRLVEALSGADVALCRWAGESARIEGQSWRSAAAVVAGRLAGDLPEVGRSLCRRAIRLPPARPSSGSRLAQLTPVDRVEAAERTLDDEMLVHVDIDGPSQAAVILNEPSLRDPGGTWTLPALYTAKQLRRALVDAAQQHVFRAVNEQEAFSLAGGLATAMRPYIARGLLCGSNGEGVPEIQAAVLRNPAAPGLVATITGYLRPWMQRVDLRVQVEHGMQPALLES